MKVVFAFGLLAFFVNVCTPKIIPIPGIFVPRKTNPKWGECFRNTEILCTQAGAKVQYNGENCVDCTCDGNDEGVTCCMVAPYPVVRNKKFCRVVLNTETCQYDMNKKPEKVEDVLPGDVRAWRHSCCFKKYEIANLTTINPTWKPDNPKFTKLPLKP